MAKANGQALLDDALSPRDVFLAFEQAKGERSPRDILDQDQHRAAQPDEQAPTLKEVATKLQEKVDAGFRALARDPVRIRAEIDRLGNGPRAYANAKARLLDAGQFAAPIFLEYLQNPTKGELRAQILRVMAEIGRPLLLPLIEELRVSDPTLKMDLVTVIGQIGYPQALPALRRAADRSGHHRRTQGCRGCGHQAH